MSAPSFHLTVGAAGVRAFLEGRKRTILRAMALALPVCLVLLLIEYQLAILCVIPLVFVLLPALDVRAFRSMLGDHEQIDLSIEGDRLRVSLSSPGAPSTPPKALGVFGNSQIVARTTPSVVYLIATLSPGKIRRFLVPLQGDQASHVAAVMRAFGSRVIVEPEPGRAIAGFFAGVIAGMVLRTVAAALVVSGIALVSLAALGRGGDVYRGAVLLVGGVFAAVLASLLAPERVVEGLEK